MKAGGIPMGTRCTPAALRQRAAPLQIRGLIIYLTACEAAAWRVVDYQGSHGRFMLHLAELVSGERSQMAAEELLPLLRDGSLAVRCDSVLR